MKDFKIVIYTLLLCAILVCSVGIIRFNNYKKYDNELYEKVYNEYSLINIYEEKAKDFTLPKNVVNYYNDSKKNVIGRIVIEKIGVEYPIIGTTTEELLKVAPCKFSGPMPNFIGNLVIVGHNYYNGTMFSNLNRLIKGDKVTITDIYGQSCNYIVKSKKVVLPTDLSVTEATTITKSELTLITCINGLKDRLIVSCIQE